MLDLTKIPYTVLSDIRERGHSDETIAQMSPQEAFSEYCIWNGLINWGGTLFRAVENLKAAEEKKS